MPIRKTGERLCIEQRVLSLRRLHSRNFVKNRQEVSVDKRRGVS